MNDKSKLVWMVVWIVSVSVTTPVCAENTDNNQSSSTQVMQDYGRDTRAWLELQRGGDYAAPVISQPGEAASIIYKRYLESFGHPLPNSFFDKDSGIVK